MALLADALTQSPADTGHLLTLSGRAAPPMHVLHHANLPREISNGEQRFAAADRQRGILGFEVWVRTLDAGAHTAPMCHVGELVVLAFSGGGKLMIEGAPQRFEGPCTLVIPPGLRFQLANGGTTALQLVWVFSSAPTPMAPRATRSIAA